MLPDGDFTKGAIAGVTQNMAKLILEMPECYHGPYGIGPAIPNNLTKKPKSGLDCRSHDQYISGYFIAVCICPS